MIVPFPEREELSEIPDTEIVTLDCELSTVKSIWAETVDVDTKASNKKAAILAIIEMTQWLKDGSHAYCHYNEAPFKVLDSSDLMLDCHSKKRPIASWMHADS